MATDTHDAFPEVARQKIDRINLQQQTPGQRGPGRLVMSGLPAHLSADDIREQCEELGPGRYKAIALDERGKPLGQAFSHVVTGEAMAPLSPKPAPVADSTHQVDQLLERLRIASDERQAALDEQRSRLMAQHDEEIERTRRAFERRISDAELAAEEREERVRAQLIEDLDAERRRAEDELRRAVEREERLQSRLEQLHEDNRRLQEQLHSYREQRSDLQEQLTNERARRMTAVAEVEAQLSAERRAHEAELREARNADTKTHALVTRHKTEWEIERERELLLAELEERAARNGVGAKLIEGLKDPQVQEVVFPALSSLVEFLAQPSRKNVSPPPQHATQSAGQQAAE